MRDLSPGAAKLLIQLFGCFFVFSETKCPCLLRVTGYSGVCDACLDGDPPCFSICKVPVSVFSVFLSLAVRKA